MSPPSAAESRGLAPIRSRSRCRRISKLPSISTWQPRRSRLGKSRSPLRATGQTRRAGEWGDTTEPKDYRKGGAPLPLGGTEGYKGSGLAAMVEVLCGLLTGLGFGVEPTGRHNDGCFMAVFNVAAFRPLEDFKKEV